ncbi:unnamed protein product [Calicophoron daubneyi]|uniref:P-type Ca(2+) transporter n=1 Tax=Calicophoron daubneyi TaxID=300641 RepID=A0AAV2T7S7_CALDB
MISEMDYHINARKAAFISSDEIALRLQVDTNTGLDQSEAERRQAAIGSNDLKHPPPDPLYIKYLEQFKEPMILLLLISAAVSLVMKQIDDTVSITMAVIIVVTVAFIQNYRSEKALESLKKLMPPKCCCLRNGRLFNFLASQLVPGDIVFLSTGDRVPADLRLFEAVDLQVDESSLTGETESVTKTSKVLPRHPPSPLSKSNAENGLSLNCIVEDGNVGDCKISFPTHAVSPPVASGEKDTAALDRLRGCHDLINIAFMGTLVRCGTAKGIVIATGEHSEFGAVFRMMQSEEAPRTPLQQSMDRLGKQLSFFSLLIIGSIVVVGLFQGRRFMELLNVGVSLAVAAIPEGLPIVVTVTLAIGQMRMASRNAIVRRLPAVETLGCVNVICADKTGTMTKNEMTVSQLVSSGLERYTVPTQLAADTEFDPTLKMNSSTLSNHCDYMYSPHLLSPCTRSHSTNELVTTSRCPPNFQRMVEIGCLCNNAVIQDGVLHGQPTEGALLRLANQLQVPDPRPLYTRLHEWPFTSESKTMMVCCTRNGHLADVDRLYFAKGAVDRILSRCAYICQPLSVVVSDDSCSPSSVKSNDSLPESISSPYILKPEHVSTILSEAAILGSLGLRVLALAEGTHVDQLTFHGLVGLLDPPRPGVDKCVRTFLESGVRVLMITGDSVETAKAIGSRLSLYRPGDFCLSGEELDQLSASDLKTRVRNVTIFYRSGPRHKCKIVKALQQSGMIVAMTGDGVNDAVALKSSNIGISMGLTGTDVCREASDIVLLDDNFATILAAMEEGKAIFHNIRNFLGFQLSTSIAALSLVAFATMLSLPTPLNAMQILFINILMDGPPAQSLGVEPPDENVTRQPPRRSQDPILDGRLIMNVLVTATCIVSGTLFTFYWELSDNHVTPRDTTMTFTCFVLFDMFSALSFRSQTKSIFSLGLTTNRMFLLAVGLSLLGLSFVVYFPPLQVVFQTESLHPHDILLLICLSSSVFFISEIRKCVSRKKLSAFKRWLLQKSTTAGRIHMKDGNSMV